MYRIGIASQNPVKVNSMLRAFEQLFPNESFAAEPAAIPSGVPDQPMSDQQTWQGAHNRLQRVREQLPNCDYWAAIEGGIDETSGGMIALAWLMVASKSDDYGEARTATFPLPPPLRQLILDGVELGTACDQLYGKENSKHAEGAIGLLSNNIIDRQAYYQHAAIMALLPIRHAELYR